MTINLGNAVVQIFLGVVGISMAFLAVVYVVEIVKVFRKHGGR